MSPKKKMEKLPSRRRKRRWSEHKDSEWRGQWSDIWRRSRWGNGYNCDWRGRQDRLHKEKHCGQDGMRKNSMLEQDQQKMKWKLALRIATSPSERWLKKAAEWSPNLSSRFKTDRALGRPRKRWEDDINDFLKQVLEEKENENPIGKAAAPQPRSALQAATWSTWKQQ